MFLSRCVLCLAFWLSGWAALAQTDAPSIPAIEALIRAGKYAQALELTSAALRLHPGDSRLWTIEGIAYSLEGDDPHALGAFRHALKLSPDDGVALRGAAQVLYKTSDQHAIPLLQRILKLDPSDPVAHEMLGTLEQKSGQCEAANEQFALSAGAVETHPASLEAAADCLVQTKRYAEALTLLQHLAAALPAQSFPEYDEAVVLIDMKEYARAAAILDDLVTKGSDDPDVLSLASEAHEATGDTPKAVSLLRQAIVAAPDNPDYYNAFVAICLNHDSYQVGVDMVDAGLARIRNNPSLYISRGLLYAELAQYDKAESDFETAEKMDSAQSLSAYAVDLTEIQMHHPELVLTRVREQLKEHPESPMLHFVLADLLADQQSAPGSPSFVEAQHEAAKAIELKPGYVEARTLLAGLDMRAGDAAASAGQCREALRYAPDNQGAIYHLILALRHTGASAQSAEIQSLVKRLSELQQQSLKDENARKRFRLVEPSSIATP